LAIGFKIETDVAVAMSGSSSSASEAAIDSVSVKDGRGSVAKPGIGWILSGEPMDFISPVEACKVGCCSIIDPTF
jgi:hypothetical protein